MSDKKKKEIDLKIKINDLPEEMSDEEMEEVTGGILASEAFRKQFLTSALKTSALKSGIAADSGHCDCWSYTAGQGDLGGLKR